MPDPISTIVMAGAAGGVTTGIGTKFTELARGCASTEAAKQLGDQEEWRPGAAFSETAARRGSGKIISGFFGNQEIDWASDHDPMGRDCILLE